jgi:hypothetical protein
MAVNVKSQSLTAFIQNYRSEVLNSTNLYKVLIQYKLSETT